jgi:6-phosphogluconolactonase (cycloisomerase 2 family)
VPTLVWPRGMVFAPAGDFLFVTNVNAGSTSSFKVDPTTGALSNRITIATPASPSIAVHHPTKRVVYVSGPDANAAYALSYDATGAMTVLSTVTVTGTPAGLTLDPTASQLYAGSTSAETITMIPLDPTTGALGTPVPHTVTNGVGGTNLAFDPSGKILLASYGINFPLLLAYSFQPDGGISIAPNVMPQGQGANRVPIVVPH